MKSRRKHTSPTDMDRLIEDAVAAEDGGVPIVERADGYYWVAPDGHQEFGPFETPELARADRDKYDERAPQVGESVAEAEREVGIADWIDPETGAPAEGLTLPRVEGE